MVTGCAKCVRHLECLNFYLRQIDHIGQPLWQGPPSSRLRESQAVTYRMKYPLRRSRRQAKWQNMPLARNRSLFVSGHRALRPERRYRPEGTSRQDGPEANSMIAKTFFLAKIIHRIGCTKRLIQDARAALAAFLIAGRRAIRPIGLQAGDLSPAAPPPHIGHPGQLPGQGRHDGQTRHFGRPTGMGGR
jgi:hypothetical protein